MAGKLTTIIYNPTSGQSGQRAERAREMVRLLEVRGIEACALATSRPGDATQLARDAAEGGAEIIVSYGGDGTINEVIQAMAGTQVALAVWQGGTANVVARDLRMPAAMHRLADVIAAGKSKRIALGLAVTDADEQRHGDAMKERPTDSPATLQPFIPTSRYFLMFAGIGLDASVAKNVNMRLKRKTGQFAYWVEGFKHVWTWPADLFKVDVDGREFESVFALIGKGKGYGGGVCLTPNARLEDPWFEIYVQPPMANKVAYLRDFAFCLQGKPEKSNATIVRGCRVRANSAAEPWVELDGEVIGRLPMNFEVVTDALSLIVP